ncbi:MAG: PqqD family protein, partial [Deltaproteobacteria bacterium]|nr:PqqD family protein [Deltaproteobacteria bacterium]
SMAWDKARKDEDFEDLGVLTLTVKGSIHQLNLVGAEIWTRINGVNTLEKISGEIAFLFGWEKKETEEAVLEFLKGIEERGWVSLEEKKEPSPPKWRAH